MNGTDYIIACLALAVVIQGVLLLLYGRRGDARPRKLKTDGTDWHVSPLPRETRFNSPCPVCKMPAPYGWVHRRQRGGWVHVDPSDDGYSREVLTLEWTAKP